MRNMRSMLEYVRKIGAGLDQIKSASIVQATQLGTVKGYTDHLEWLLEQELRSQERNAQHEQEQEQETT